MRRGAGCALALALVACAATPRSPRDRSGPAARNVVLVMTDDQGFGDFGFQGATLPRTPHLDRLASESATVASFYVSPVCAPTRAALMTGRWPQRARVIDTYLGRAMLPPEEVTLAERLGAAGFATGIFGKWHLGDCLPMRPEDQGFGRSLVHRGGGIGQPTDPEGGEGRYSDPLLWDDGELVATRGYCTDVYFDAAIEWIGQRHAAGERFFAYLPTNAPHGPFDDVPEERRAELAALGLGDREARVFAMIEGVDDALGRLLAALDELDAREDTLVLFLVDNGPNTRRYVGPLRGMKGEVFEGGVRSPLLARWPAGFPAGVVVDRVAAHVDLVPTILEAAGVPLDPTARAAPADGGLDGRSLAPLLAGRAADALPWPDRALVVQAHRGDAPVYAHNALVRTQDWKLVNPSGFGRAVDAVEVAWELYRPADDPGEAHDLAAERPEVVAELAGRYDAWFADVGAGDPARYEPPRILLDGARAPRVDLTRQDWRRRGAGEGWGAGARGAWLLEVRDPGPWTARVRFREGVAPEGLTLEVGDAAWIVDVARGAHELTLPGLVLPAGPGHLEATLTWGDADGRAAHEGAWQVILERDGP